MQDEPTPVDPVAMRRSALVADVQRVSELLAQCVAEAMALDLPIRKDVYSVTAIIDGWAKEIDRHVGTTIFRGGIE